MNWRMNKHNFWEPKITAEMNQLSAHFSVRNTGNWRDNKHALGFLPPRLKKKAIPGGVSIRWFPITARQQ